MAYKIYLENLKGIVDLERGKPRIDCEMYPGYDSDSDYTPTAATAVPFTTPLSTRTTSAVSGVGAPLPPEMSPRIEAELDALFAHLKKADT